MDSVLSSHAAGQTEEYLRDKSYEDYADSGLLQAGVERKFEIVGEAVSQLAKIEPASRAGFDRGAAPPREARSASAEPSRLSTQRL